MKKNKVKKRNSISLRITFDLVPVILCCLVLPFVTRLYLVKTDYARYPWFPSVHQWGDLFLYGRMRVFILIAAICVVVLADAFLIKRDRFQVNKYWLFLPAYGILALLSAIFSHYRDISFQGGIEQFENIYVLLGYGVICFYAFYIVRTKKDYRLLFICSVIGAFLLSFIGLSQLLGKDLIRTDLAQSLIVPQKLSGYKDALSYNFSSENSVYMTLYNPNYVGTYVCLLFPVCLGIMKNERGKWLKYFSGVTAFFLIICLIGSGSKTGIFALAAALFYVFFFEKICRTPKYRILFYLGMVLGIAALFILGFMTRKEMTSKLSDIAMSQEEVQLTYNGYELHMGYEQRDGGIVPVFKDAAGEPSMCEYDTENKVYLIIDERMKDVRIGCVVDGKTPYLAVYYDDYQWVFSDATEDGAFHYITMYGKEDVIKEAQRILPDSVDGLFTYRGYIWNRTLPLLGDCLLLGSGPDTFAVVFPQNDYVRRAAGEKGFFSEILTKPHCMYLQWALQTGVLSCMCMMAFLFWIGKDAFGVFRKETQAKSYSDTYVKYLTCSFVAYLLAGICNDSCIATAPIFWIFAGILAGLTQQRQGEEA